MSAAVSSAGPDAVASSHDIAAAVALALRSDIAEEALRCSPPQMPGCVCIRHIPVHARLPGSFQTIASGFLRALTTLITSNRSCSESTRGLSQLLA